MARRYARDNRGRFASNGTGATARGGRLKTASGNKRAAQTKGIAGGKPAGAIKGKVKRDPGAAGKVSKPTNNVAKSPRQLTRDQKIARDVMADKRFRSDRQRIAEMTKRGIKPGTDVGALVADVRAKQGGGTTARIKPAAAKPAASKAAKLEFSRSAAIRRYDRADTNVQKYEARGDAFRANRARLARDSYAAANRATRNNEARQRDLYRAQERYSTISKPKSARKPALAKGKTIGHTEAYQRRSEAQLKRGIETGRRAQQYLAEKGAFQAPLGSKLSLAHSKAQRVEWASRNAFNARANRRLNSGRKQWERG